MAGGSSWIVSSLEVLGGKPCLRGTRIPVELVLEKLGAGETAEEILASYGYLSEEHIRAAIEYGKVQGAGRR
jgi:uncharacterized protein (DUF433 family)